ncbi:hypothetical protein [Halomonas colorata]|uniref:Potassium channel domain-containing protein n=2 Tax=Halomonas TaxID=2745 RepID=A0ABR9G0A9_9GAMM|nr:hypothetical protein [Halomonas colorata]MBE0464279.1 hypothetical protein [Halomonas colorata]
MVGLNKTYSRVFLFTSGVLIFGLLIPYSKNEMWAFILLLFLSAILFVFVFVLVNAVEKLVKNKFSSVRELQFLFVILVFLYAGIYFLLGLADIDERLIRGLREIREYSNYKLYTVNGFFEYLHDVFLTYFNSLYYSIVIMSTLGDSGIVIKNTFVRLIVVSQVIATLSLTIFKIVEHYSNHSLVEARMSELKILNEIKNINRDGLEDGKPRLLKELLRKIFNKHKR